MRVFLPAVFTIAIGLSSSVASADEVWVCEMPEVSANEKPIESRYVLTDDFFVEVAMPGRIYHVLANSDVGLVAADGIAVDKDILNVPGIPSPTIGSTTFLINKKTKIAMRVYFSIPAPLHTPQQGTCRKQIAGEAGAVWPKGYKFDGDGK